MYWFRADNPLTILPWLVVALFWVTGGWLAASHAFRLERGERLLVGIGLGLSGYLWLVNLFGHWLDPIMAFALPGPVFFLVGAAFAWKDERPWLDLEDLHVWPQLLAGLMMMLVFLLIGKGLAIFDEPKNLTIISNMAAGDIPPHYYLNSSFFFRYHYGFQLFGASLVRLGGLFPWSAFDASKAIVFGLSLLLAYLVGKRYIAHPSGGFLTAGAFAFVSGTRYLLALIPNGLLVKADPHVPLIGTSEAMGVPFSQSLSHGWTIDGGPPFPFLFAFLNGIFPSLTMAHAGSVAYSAAILLLLVLLLPRMTQRGSFIVVAILLAMWAMVWESSYVLFMIGGAVAWLASGLIGRSRSWREWVTPIALALALSVPLVILQGGTITEIFRNVFLSTPDAGIGVEGSVSSTGFTLRWPPAVTSAHLGALNLFSPWGLLVALAELGPVILLTPWISWWAWRRFRTGEWVFGALLVSAWVGFVLPLVLVYQAERDISRLTGHALLVWTLFLLVMVWEAAPGWKKWLRQAGIGAIGLMVFGGFVVTGIELTAISSPTAELGYELNGLDARIMEDCWDTLSPGEEVFDPGFWRASALMGRKTRAAVGNEPTAEWLHLYAEPTWEEIKNSGYRWVYVDEIWWEEIPQKSRDSLSAACVTILEEEWDANNLRFRRLLDLENCTFEVKN